MLPSRARYASTIASLSSGLSAPERTIMCIKLPIASSGWPSPLFIADEMRRTCLRNELKSDDLKSPNTPSPAKLGSLPARREMSAVPSIFAVSSPPREVLPIILYMRYAIVRVTFCTSASRWVIRERFSRTDARAAAGIPSLDDTPTLSFTSLKVIIILSRNVRGIIFPPVLRAFFLATRYCVSHSASFTVALSPS